ncbi:amidohydrolase family protein [Alkalibaculum sp. M08DMB]|uniref:Amidohydrolase family protein n=1 Tax=Alkalibaculum sporogenes TaxID=2655001 RepID=A0A6A7K862_9FIRM|nr:amidohydrolase [Alkalibaculum sporogenes]MPW25575.1 amidohydrolase family protein [Alkalibaculum sporogenes]
MKADFSFINGKIYTMETKGDFVEAFSVYDRKFTACGTTDEILEDPGKKVIDLGGAIIVPGMIDAHQHTLYHAKNLQTVDLSNTASWEEAKKILKEKADMMPYGSWIHAAGFDHQKWRVPELPLKEDLDEISTRHPIVIDRYCLHVHVVNSKVLDIVGIKKGYIPHIENTIGFDESDEPNGIIWDSGIAPVLKFMPDPLEDYEIKKQAVYDVLTDMNKYGITGVHPVQGKIVDSYEYLGLYQDLDKEGRLTVRMYVSFDELPPFGMKTGFGNNMVKYGFYKIYSDGNLGSRSAAMLEPFSDRPDMKGVLNYSQDEITAMCQEAYDKDLQIGIHAIGDKGLDIVLKAIEKVYYKNPKNDPRFRLIHAFITNEDLIMRIKRLPVIIDMQPCFLSTNVTWAEDRLGPERIKYAFPWRRMVDEGIILTASSDLPVEHYNPFWGIYAIVARKNLEGFPKEGWYPNQRVTTYEALEMYTKNAAYASFEEDIKGTIKTGKLADFVVLDRDPFDTDIDSLKDIKVRRTYLGGRLVYSSDN